MQKFNRALTREIEVGGERLAVTLSEEGLSFRVVGSRKPPHDLTWTACLIAATKEHAAAEGPDEAAAALKALRAGGKERATETAPTTATPPNHPPEPRPHEPHAGHGPVATPAPQPPAHEPKPTTHETPPM